MGENVACNVRGNKKSPLQVHQVHFLIAFMSLGYELVVFTSSSKFIKFMSSIQQLALSIESLNLDVDLRDGLACCVRRDVKTPAQRSRRSLAFCFHRDKW